jgi:D-alanine-D-alanine ligase-like ATP-grasp enzyme
MRSRRTVVVFAGTRAYQVGELTAAAERLGVDVVIASDRCHVLDEHFEIDASLAVDFADPGAAIAAVTAAVPDIDGVIATDERTATLAAALAAAVGLPHNRVDVAKLGGDKLEARRAMAAAGLDQPAFAELDLTAPEAPMGFPAVIKPRCLSASRGVIRVDDPDGLAAPREDPGRSRGPRHSRRARGVGRGRGVRAGVRARVRGAAAGWRARAAGDF